jgi:hypothetical protein
MLSLAWGLGHAALSNPPVLGRAAPGSPSRPRLGQAQVPDQQGPASRPQLGLVVRPVRGGEGAGAASSAHPGVAFVGADNRDTPSAFTAFEKLNPHPYPAGPIVDGTYQSYGVAGLPATFFIDSHGVVVASFVGPLDAATLDHYLDLIAT